MAIWCGTLARQHTCRAPRRLLRRPGSRLHKRRGQALCDPPLCNLAAAVALSGKYGGESPEGQSGMDQHVPPNVSADVPLLSQPERNNGGKIASVSAWRSRSGAGKGVKTRSPNTGTSGISPALASSSSAAGLHVQASVARFVRLGSATFIFPRLN